MSIRTFTTNVVDCDGEDCEGCFYDAVPMTPNVAINLARHHKWSRTPDGKDLCPACTAKRNQQPAQKGGAA